MEDYAAPGAMREDVAGVTVTRLGSSSPADDEEDLETWRARVEEAAASGAVGTSDGSVEGPPARLAVLVPFREDEDGTRGPQLDALLRRLRLVFRGVAPVVMCVATQSHDGRRFNRGQCLNAAFLHLRRTRPGWWDARTLWCFHDCDMLPREDDSVLAAHYLRAGVTEHDTEHDENGDENATSADESIIKSGGKGFVRVLEAGGCRYDADGCFGGVTVYDERGFVHTNGYPNGFWGWGGEDNAQFLRCVCARLRLERIPGCSFEDLERLDTVEEKLAVLDTRRARCPAKDKRRLLRVNAHKDGWRRDGLVDLKYETIEESALFFGDDDDVSNDDVDDLGVRGVRVVVKLLSGIDDELVCVQCGVSKGPGGFAVHQYRSAMFWAKRTGGGVSTNAAASGDGSSGDPACHWDDERGVRDTPAIPSGGVSFSGGGNKRGARCLACVAGDPRVVKDRAAEEANATDATRVVCAICDARFAARNALFKHLRESGHGEQAEAAERAAKAAAAIGS